MVVRTQSGSAQLNVNMTFIRVYKQNGKNEMYNNRIIINHEFEFQIEKVRPKCSH